MASTKRSDGEGSIYFDASRKRYVGSYVVGWRDGKPIRKKVSGTSRAAAAAKLRELREKVAAGELPSGRLPTVAEWMTYWLDQIAAHKVRPSTMRGYRTYVDCYINPLLGDRRIDRLTPEHIADAWHQLQTVGRPGVPNPRPLSPTSALQAHRVLARALKVAHQRGIVTRNVATLLDAPTPADVEMEPLTKADARKVLNAAKGRRNAARWSVALSLGLRQGEALGLKWDHVDLEAGTVAVRRALSRVKGKGLVLGPVKSRAGRRTIKVPGPLLAELKTHRVRQNTEKLAAGSFWLTEVGNIEGDTTANDLVFTHEDGRAIDPKLDWMAWKQLLDAAGVPDRRLHDARHTAATLLLAQGVPPRVVMEILGHSRITVTSKYQHVLDEMHTDAAAKMATLWADEEPG